MNQPITIITGAGSGVGRSLAITLAAQGHHIALAGRTRSKLEETASQCSASPGLMIHPTDLRDEPSAATLVDDVIAGDASTILSIVQASHHSHRSTERLMTFFATHSP